MIIVFIGFILWPADFAPAFGGVLSSGGLFNVSSNFSPLISPLISQFQKLTRDMFWLVYSFVTCLRNFSNSEQTHRHSPLFRRNQRIGFRAWDQCRRRQARVSISAIQIFLNSQHNYCIASAFFEFCLSAKVRKEKDLIQDKFFLGWSWWIRCRFW